MKFYKLSFILILLLVNGCGKYKSTKLSDAENQSVTQDQLVIQIANIGYNAREPVFQGQPVEVPINITGSLFVGGFDLLISYDKAALNFQSATPGKDLTDNNWEYFTYGYDLENNCTDNCPSGLIRITAIAETNLGSNHPTKANVSEIAVLKFMVTNDRTYECTKIDLNFYWLKCNDNSFSSWDHDTTFISSKVYHTYPKNPRL